MGSRGGGGRADAGPPLDDSLPPRADAGHPNLRAAGIHGSSGSRGCPRWWGTRGPRTYPSMGGRMSGATCGMAFDGRAIVGSISYAAGPSPHHPPSKEPLNGVGRLPDLHSPHTIRGVCTSDLTRGARMLCIKADERATDTDFRKAIKDAVQFMQGNWNKEQSLPHPSSMCVFRRRPPGFPARYYLQPHPLEDCVRVRPRTHAPSTYKQFAGAG